MNEENNNFNKQNENATVIGELRKDKIGKPVIVVEMLVLFLVVLIALPFVRNMMEDETSVLYKFFNKTSGGSTSPNISLSKKQYVNGGVKQPLVNTTKMKFEDIIIENIYLGSDGINCNISSYNGILTLDNEPYYLEVYSNSEKLIGVIKLTGTYDFQPKSVLLTLPTMNFNATYNYFGLIKKMKNSEYPAVQIESDESGVGSFICEANNRSIEYVFKNNYLIRIYDKQNILLDNYKSEEYLKLKENYETKKKALGSIASVEENNAGFEFKASIDLEKKGFTIPNSVNDYNYYKLDTEAKLIHYELVGKGFDCK